MMSTVSTVSTMSTRVSRHCYQASTNQLLSHYDVYNIYSLYSLYKDFQGLLMKRKKPKLNAYNTDHDVPDWIKPRPATYAINKINNLEYIKLDYFTTRGCREASMDTGKLISQDTLTFTHLEGSIAIRPLASLRPSRNIRNDEELSWEEMMEAKNTMLHFMVKSAVWPMAHAESLAAF